MNNKKVLTSLIKLPLICMVAALVIAAALVFLSTRSTIADEVTATLIDQRMQNLQFLTNRRQDDLMSQARTISNSARLSRLLETGTQDELSEEEARIRATIPYAIRVRLFRIGQARVERDAIPPFTFTSLDLVNEVETGNSVFPEAINANGRWLISLATPVTPPNDNRLRGTMFVYLDLASVTDMLQGDHQGRVSLIQKFPTGPETEILSMGEAGSLPESRISLSNPNWQIAFSANDSLAHDGGGLLSHLIPVITLFLISTIGVVFSLIRVSQQLSEDASLYIHQISDLASDLYKPHQGYHFGVFDELDSELSRLGPAPAATTPMLEPGALQLGSATTAALTPDEGLAEPENTDLMAEVDDLLADEEPTVSAPVPEADAADLATIFRAYDIRGIVGKTLTPDVIRRIGMALGTEAQDIGEHTLLVAADGRLSSPGVSTALIDGITATGCDVINLGTTATPVLYYATQVTGNRSGIMITGSHNPADYNGFKIVMDGQTYTEEDIQRLYRRFQENDFNEGAGMVSEMDVRGEYTDAILDDVVIAQPLKVVVDCGNGVAGDIVPDLFMNLGCDVIPLYCEVDGNFPHHHPDPTIASNLDDLILTVSSQGADIGLAFDGDGDRVVAVSSTGEIIPPDRMLMLFAKDVVSRNPGADVVYDVKCTRHLNSVISGFGGRPIICRSGHSYLKAKMVETGAILGGELSGHFCFGERWFGFDDGIYSAARLLEIVGSQTAGLNELMAEFPASVTTPEIQLFVTEAEKFSIVDTLINNGDFADGTLTTVDGIRVDYSDGWGLVRASNTNPCLTLRFEADNNEALERVKKTFRDQLLAINANLDF